MPDPVFHTPDGRYIVVRGRLWRASNPALSPESRADHVARLMQARRAVASARRRDDGDALRSARAQVDAAKHLLGERGPVWWNDGAPDLNRRMIHTTLYASWYANVVALQTSGPFKASAATSSDD
ncbi:MAG TPA: hypothetical protein VMR43_17265 [Variovorax sp.]|nr:hypothetical protein [Variovorax sp.]